MERAFVAASMAAQHRERLAKRRKVQSRRCASLDSSSYLSSHSHVGEPAGRSLSAGEVPRGMNRLSFQNIDLLNTPLSSMRSCSEYHKDQTLDSHLGPVLPPKPRSFLSQLFSWAPRPRKVRFLGDSDEGLFMIESLRFHQENLREGDYDYSSGVAGGGGDRGGRRASTGGVTARAHSTGGSRSRSTAERSRSTGGSAGRTASTGSWGARLECDIYTQYTQQTRGGSAEGSGGNVGGAGGRGGSGGGTGGTASGDGTRRQVSSSSTSSAPIRRTRRKGVNFFRESLVSWNAVFGYGPRNRHLPMEIELRDLCSPVHTYAHTYHGPYSPYGHGHGHFYGGRLGHGSHGIQEEALGIRRNSSVHSLGSLRSLRSRTESDHTESPAPPVSRWPWARERIQARTLWLRQLYTSRLQGGLGGLGGGGDYFYECLRIQPFAAGSYLRAMLWTGFCSTVFAIYHVVFWPQLHTTAAAAAAAQGNVLYSTYIVEYVLYLFAWLQLVLNLVQLPFRLRVNSLCWDSGMVEAELAINFVRTTLHCDAWMCNRMLGAALDILNLSLLCLCEVLLWTPTPLRSQVVSLGATALLPLLLRLAVATAFGLSMHDPDVLRDARRRGLSKWDIDTLPSFVFSCCEDVNNADCCICLGTFELGEMLTCLPCDEKHSFHGGCIRQWLERQNSCPLCQRMV